MKYAYEDMSDDQFERLVVLLCQRLLGIGVQGFSKGQDGGKDGRFEGTAELHPSRTAPWVGITIIQAKHTNGYNRHFLESDFFSEDGSTATLNEEILRVKKLRSSRQLDHFMLFSNRKLAGNAHTKITEFISKECGIPTQSIYLCGVEQLELWFKQFPDVPILADLDPVDSPLIVSPDDLALIVEALAENRNLITQIVDDPPTFRTSFEDKNRLNGMTEGYAKALRKTYLKDTKQIHGFLSAPENQKLLLKYESVADEFQLKIIAKRKQHQNFDEVMEYLADLLFGRDPILRQHRRLTRTMLFYMYWNCDIGEVEDAKTD